MSTPIRLSAVILCALVLAPAAYAQAQRPVDRQAAEAACGGDAQRLCGPVIPDEDKIAQCLRSNRDKLTPACRAILR